MKAALAPTSQNSSWCSLVLILGTHSSLECCLQAMPYTEESMTRMGLEIRVKG